MRDRLRSTGVRRFACAPASFTRSGIRSRGLEAGPSRGWAGWHVRRFRPKIKRIDVAPHTGIRVAGGLTESRRPPIVCPCPNELKGGDPVSLGHVASQLDVSRAKPAVLPEDVSRRRADEAGALPVAGSSTSEKDGAPASQPGPFLLPIRRLRRLRVVRLASRPRHRGFVHKHSFVSGWFTAPSGVYRCADCPIRGDSA